MGDTQSGRPLDPEQWGEVSVPTLVLVGGKSLDWLANGRRSVAGLLPRARHQVLEGQTHTVTATALAPTLKRFPPAA